MKQLKQTNKSKSKEVKNLLELIENKLHLKEGLFIFFDYDGVLRPLQDDPKTAYISSALRKKNNKTLKVF